MARVTILNGEPKKNQIVWVLSLVVLIVVVGAVYGIMKLPSLTGLNVLDSNTTGSSSGSEQVELTFYVMSQCPYGTQVENAIKPVLDQLGDAIDFNLHYIANELPEGGFRSLHGQPEVEGNIVQLCAAKYHPDNYMDMIICQNKNAGAIPDNWEACAKENNLNVEAIKSCYEGSEGSELLKASIVETNKVGATGSPTIYLNGVSYNGGRSTADFLRAVCNSFDSSRPEACSNIPEPKKVSVIVLNDKRCKECAVTGILGQLQGLFPGMQVRNVDYSSEEGRELYEKNSLSALPAILFDSSVEEGEGYAQVSPYLENRGDYFSLRIGASHDPTDEICGNSLDDDADGLTDCEDDACKGEYSCMEKLERPKVELFVMSHCPYGTQMEKGMLPVKNLLGDKIDLQIKFVYYAMHGKVEVYEELNQWCIQEEQTDKYLPYLTCFLDAGDGDACLQDTGIDTDKLADCVRTIDTEFDVTKNFEDQANWLSGQFPLFDVDKADNERYGVAGSPTLIVNGVQASSGRDSNSILKAVCTGFSTKPEECSQTLTSDTPSPGFGFSATASPATAAGSCG